MEHIFNVLTVIVYMAKFVMVIFVVLALDKLIWFIKMECERRAWRNNSTNVRRD
jgi:hypothetical protein